MSWLLLVLVLVVAGIADGAVWMWPHVVFPVVLSVWSSVLLGYMVFVLKSHRRASANAALLCEVLRDQLGDNESILKRIHAILEPGITTTQTAVGAVVSAPVPRIRPYLLAWELFVHLSNESLLPFQVVSLVARLRRKFDYLSLWLDAMERMSDLALLRGWKHDDAEAYNACRCTILALVAEAEDDRAELLSRSDGRQRGGETWTHAVTLGLGALLLLLTVALYFASDRAAAQRADGARGKAPLVTGTGEVRAMPKPSRSRRPHDAGRALSGRREGAGETPDGTHSGPRTSPRGVANTHSR
jgi:hypothetical protein